MCAYLTTKPLASKPLAFYILASEPLALDLSIHLSVCLCIYLSLYPHLSMYPYFFYISINLPIYRS